MSTKPLYEWDEAKRALNIGAHKVDFTTAEEFDWASAVTEVDDREDYGELREIAVGFIGLRLHVMVYTRRGDAIRIISLWKAQRHEVRRYVERTR